MEQDYDPDLEYILNLSKIETGNHNFNQTIENQDEIDYDLEYALKISQNTVIKDTIEEIKDFSDEECEKTEEYDSSNEYDEDFEPENTETTDMDFLDPLEKLDYYFPTTNTNQSEFIYNVKLEIHQKDKILDLNLYSNDLIKNLFDFLIDYLNTDLCDIEIVVCGKKLICEDLLHKKYIDTDIRNRTKIIVRQ